MVLGTTTWVKFNFDSSNVTVVILFFYISCISIQNISNSWSWYYVNKMKILSHALREGGMRPASNGESLYQRIISLFLTD